MDLVRVIGVVSLDSLADLLDLAAKPLGAINNPLPHLVELVPVLLPGSAILICIPKVLISQLVGGLAILLSPIHRLILDFELLIGDFVGKLVKRHLALIGYTKLLLGKLEPVLAKLRLLERCKADVRIRLRCRSAATLLEHKKRFPRLALWFLVRFYGQNPIDQLRCEVSHQKQGNHCQANDHHCFIVHGSGSYVSPAKTGILPATSRE